MNDYGPREDPLKEENARLSWERHEAYLFRLEHERNPPTQYVPNPPARQQPGAGVKGDA